MKNYYSLLLILTFSVLLGVKSYAATQTYLIPQGQLINCATTCGANSYYNDCAGGIPGFSWTDVLPSGANVSAVSIELSIGVECGAGTRTTQLNGVAQSSFTTVAHCLCTDGANGIKTINANVANYNIGGANTFYLTNPVSCLGFCTSASLSNSYARVTVTYTTTPCSFVAQETSPDFVSNGTGCGTGSFTMGSGAYYDLTISANTYYDFTFTESAANISGFCAYALTPLGSSSAFTTNQTGWYSGSITQLRVTALRSSSTWTSTSATMTYRRSAPVAGSTTQSPASGSSVCQGTGVTYTASGFSRGSFSYFQYQWNGTGGSWSGSWITSNPGTWTSGLNGASVLYVRSVINNNGCTSASSPVNVTVNSNPGTANNTTSTAAICESQTKALTGTPAGGTWSVISGGGTISGTTYTPANIASNTNVTVRYTIAANGACPGSTDDVTFTVNSNPGAANNTTSTVAICESQTKALTGTPAGGTWSVISGGGTISGTTYTPANITSNTNVTIRYSVAANGACGATTDDAVFTVNSNPGAANNTTSTAAICESQTKALTATPAGGTWSVISGGGTIAGTTYTPADVASNTSVTIRYSVAANGACGATTDDAVFTVNSNPGAANNTTSTAAICESQTKALTGTPAGGTWSVISGGGTISGTTYTPADVASNTSVTIRYSIAANGACGATTDDAVFTVNSNPGAANNTTSTAAICESQTKALTGTPAGGTWSVISGGGTISGTTYTPADVASNTSVTIRYSIAANGACGATTDDAVFTVNSNPGAANNTTSTAAICESQTKALTGTPAGGTWSVISGGGTIAGTTYTPADVASNTNVTIRYSVAANGACGATNDDAVFTVNSNPGAADNTTSNTAICGNNSTRTLTGTPAGGTFSLFSGPGSVSGATYTATGSGNAVVRYTIAANGSCSGSTEDVTIPVNATSQGGTATADQVICAGSSPADLNLSGNTGNIQWQYANDASFTAGVNNIGGATGSTLSSAQMGSLSADRYYRAVVTSGVCPSANSTVVAIDVQNSLGAVTVTPSANPICQGSSLGLSATNYTGATYNWSGPGSYTATGQSITRTGIQESTGEGAYTVTATNSCGNVTASATINVHAPIPGVINVVYYSPYPGTSISALCQGNDLQIRAEAATAFPNDITWTWSGPNGYTSNVQNPLITGVQPSQHSGPYDVNAANVCGSIDGYGNSITVDTRIDANPDVAGTSNSGTNDLDPITIEACGSYNLTLTGNNPSPGTGNWTLGSTTPSVSAQVTSWGGPTTNQSVNPTVNEYGAYTFTWTVTNGTCNDDSSIRVFFTPAVSVAAELAGCSFVSPGKDIVQITASGGWNPGSQPAANYLTITPPAGDNLLTDLSTNPQLQQVFTADFDGLSHTYKVDDQICVYTPSVTTNSNNSTDIPLTATAGVDSTRCIDKSFDQWLTFRDNNNNAILAIDDNNQDLGEVTVKVYKDAAIPSIAGTAGNTCAGYPNTAMQRHFVITAGNTFLNPVDVRLYFSEDELNELVTASQANDMSSDNCSYNDNLNGINDLYVTKYTGTDEDGDYTNNAPGGLYKVYGNPTALPTQPDGPLNKSFNGFNSVYSGGAQHHYVQLSVSEFSELWLHGSGNGTALPVEMLYMEANALNNTYIQVKWATALEINNNGFQVERSTDGSNWTAIGWVDGHNNTTTQQNYTYDDYSVQPNQRYYYRLKQIDNDGQYEYTGIVSAIVNLNITFDIKDFIPNPAINTTTLIVTASNEQSIEVEIFNGVGQKVIAQKHNLNKGSNQINFDITKLAAGTYNVLVASANEVYGKKLVIVK